jgi:hypothetical protein
VRVIHHHREPLPRIDRLHPAWHSLERSERGRPGREVHADHPGRAESRQAVLDVEGSAKRGPDRDVVHAERRALRPDLDVDGAQVGGRTDPVGDDRDRGGVDDPAAPRIVDIHDAHDRVLGIEQTHLRLEVRLHRPVEVQVVLRQVREDGRVERQTVDAVVRERVRRHLDRDRGHALVSHPGEEPMEVWCLGGRSLDRDGGSRDPGAGRPDHARRPSGRAEDRLQQVRARGLPVRPGDADRGQVLRGPAEHDRGHRSDRLADRADSGLRHTEGQPPLDDQGPGAGGERLGGMVVPVVVDPWDAEEERTGDDRSRVVARVGQRPPVVVAHLSPCRGRRVRERDGGEEGVHRRRAYTSARAGRRRAIRSAARATGAPPVARARSRGAGSRTGRPVGTRAPRRRPRTRSWARR